MLEQLEYVPIIMADDTELTEEGRVDIPSRPDLAKISSKVAQATLRIIQESRGARTLGEVKGVEVRGPESEMSSHPATGSMTMEQAAEFAKRLRKQNLVRLVLEDDRD